MRLVSPRVVLLLALVIVLELSGAAGVLTWRQPGAVPGPAAPPAAVRQLRVAPGPDPGTPLPQITALLAARSAAVLHRDRAAFLRTLDPAGATYRRRQVAVFDNLRQVPLSAWSYTVVAGPSRKLPAAARLRYGTATYTPAAVTLAYRLRGFDIQPATAKTYPTFVRRGSRWYLGGDGDLQAQGLRSARQLWDFGPVAVSRGRSTLVLGHPASPVPLSRTAAEVDRAVPAVSAVWGSGWARRVVVQVPRDAAELRAIVGGSTDFSRIAAVATAELRVDRAGRHPYADRVLLNPATFRTLSPLGRRIVLTHEVTHVATRAATGPGTPLWLAEGFADYVGYRATGISVRTAADELARAVRTGRLPAALPTRSDFAGSNPALPLAYEGGWLACRLIAATAGVAGLVRFFRAAGAGTADRAFGDVLHTTPATFTAAWRRSLTAQLS